LLPKNFDILADDIKLSERPILLQTWDDTEVWYKKDDKFKRPKGIVSLKLYTNDCNFSRTPTGRLFAEIWNECLSEFSREFIYMADCAGLKFD
jgi:secreted Zn-dependent insulinase-like peptidase